MKILFADDDQVLLKVVDEFLTKSGYQVELCRTGEIALERLLAADAPQIALLDWMMPGFSGPEICRQLVERGLKADRYLLILSSKTKKKDIAEGLISGADDYLGKPVDFTELLARIRVAERTVHAHNELKQRTEQLEDLVRRNNLLGELVVRQTGSPPDPDKPRKPLAGNLSQRTAQLPGLGLFPYQLCDILKNIGMDAQAVSVVDEIMEEEGLPQPPGLLSWTPLLLPSNGLWLDVIMQTTHKAGEQLTQHLFKDSNPAVRSMCDALAELSNMGHSVLKGHLRDQELESVMPLLSRSRFEEHEFPEAQAKHQLRAGLAVNGEPLLLIMSEYHAPIVEKTLPELMDMDILSKPVVAIQSPSNVLLSKWKPLSSATIATLRRWVQSETIPNHFNVIQPSPLARKLSRHFAKAPEHQLAESR